MLVLHGAEDSADVITEADIEHAVDFIEHSELDVVIGQEAAAVHVHDAAGRADDDVGVFFEFFSLDGHLLPAVDGCYFEFGESAELAQFMRDLDCKFTGWNEDERGKCGALFGRGQQMHDWQAECSGFAGPGFGLAQYIATGQRQWDQRSLHLGGVNPALFVCTLDESVGKPEIFEGLAGIKYVLDGLHVVPISSFNGDGRERIGSIQPLRSIRIGTLHMHDASVIEINLSAIGHNIRLLRKIIGTECMVCPIVKADAYGLGAVRVSRTLLSAGAEMLAVYTAGEAAALLRAGISKPILVLMPIRAVERADDLYRGLICNRLHLTIHDEEHLRTVIGIVERFGASVPVHLEIDTGMSRGGCALDDAPAILKQIAEHKRLELAGVFTHFADAERDPELTEQQLAAFDAVIEEQGQYIGPTCLVHAANTYATLRAERYHKSMVRVGLAWAGYGMESLSGGEIIADGQYLKPAITWRSRLVQLRTIAAGTTVGYGSRWRAQRATRLGLVPVGYADGYPVGAGRTEGSAAAYSGDASAGGDGAALGGGYVAVVTGDVLRFAPVVGAVSMDQITVDLTDICAEADVSVGTEVQLITPDTAAPNHLPRLAAAGGTFPHEMICRLNPRLRRVYRSLPSHLHTDVRAAQAAAVGMTG